MAYADELLELARDIAKLRQPGPDQASLRRAVSTAYYALFHLLIAEATASCTNEELRFALLRLFDHGGMKQAADRKASEMRRYFKGRPREGPERTVNYHLLKVTNAFIRSQGDRNEADYNTSRLWDTEDVLVRIEAIGDALKSWQAIREEPAAQSFLVSMLPVRRQTEVRPILGNS